ncbi:MAG: hypothetical protein AB7R89_04180 [Dehalococcoidia bacterium]
MNTREDDERTQAGTHQYEEPSLYEIRVMGHLDDHWSAWFDGMSLSRESNGTTNIHGPVADQAVLHGLLQRVRDLGLELVAVGRLKTK